MPVVRELAAYRADDQRPLLAPPWLLSVNANLSAESHTHARRGAHQRRLSGESLQRRFVPLDARAAPPTTASTARSARTARPSTPRRATRAGEAAGGHRGRRPAPRPRSLLSQSSPPPIAVLSGSDDWDHGAAETGPDPIKPKRWHWDPLRDARGGRDGPARARRPAARRTLPRLLRRRADPRPPRGPPRRRFLAGRRPPRTSTSSFAALAAVGPIRGFAPPIDLERAWPGDPHPPRPQIQFVPTDPLFVDLAERAATLHHAGVARVALDAVRADAFFTGSRSSASPCWRRERLLRPRRGGREPARRRLPQPQRPRLVPTETQPPGVTTAGRRRASGKTLATTRSRRRGKAPTISTSSSSSRRTTPSTVTSAVGARLRPTPTRPAPQAPRAAKRGPQWIPVR